MASARLARIAFYLLSAFAMWAGHEAFAESSPLLATFTRPAVFVAARAAPAEGGEAALPRRAHVIIGVTEYHPADDGTPVEVVVKGRVGGGAEREVAVRGYSRSRFQGRRTVRGSPFQSSFARRTHDQRAGRIQRSAGSRRSTAGEARDKGAYLRVGEAEIR